MQIPAFLRTFSQKMNSCESAKYHTSPHVSAVADETTRRALANGKIKQVPQL